MEDILNRSVKVPIDNKEYLLEPTHEKVQEGGIRGFGFLFRVIDEETDTSVGCFSAYISPTAMAVWRNNTKFEITEQGIENLFLSAIPNVSYKIDGSKLLERYAENRCECIKVRIDTRDTQYVPEESTLYVRGYESPEEFIKQYVFWGKITDEYLEKEILKLLNAYRESNELGYKTKVLVKDLHSILYVPEGTLLRSLDMLEGEGLIDSNKSNDEYVSVSISHKGAIYVRNNFIFKEGGEVIVGDKIQGDKITATSYGNNSPNIIKSDNVAITIELINKLEREIEYTYKGDDKTKVLQEVKELKMLTKNGKDKAAVLSKLGSLLSKVSDFATIVSLVVQLIPFFK